MLGLVLRYISFAMTPKRHIENSRRAAFKSAIRSLEITWMSFISKIPTVTGCLLKAQLINKLTPLEIAKHLKAFKQKEFHSSRTGNQRCENIGNAIVTIDPPSASSPYPSANGNAVHYFGCSSVVSRTDLLKILNTMKESQVERFFFWVSPNPQQEEIVIWLLAHGFKPFQGTQYPTLIRSIEAETPHATSLRVERVPRLEVENRADAIRHIYKPWNCSFFFESVNLPGFEHFLAYESDTPVSAAILGVYGDFAYLGWAATAEDHRGKGGQNSLIRARLNRAAALGCQIACSETLTMLKTSLRNLERNGFKIIYTKQVFVWET